MEFTVSQMFFSNSSYALEITPSMNTAHQIKSAFTKHMSGTLLHKHLPLHYLLFEPRNNSMRSLLLLLLMRKSRLTKPCCLIDKTKVQPRVADN